MAAASKHRHHHGHVHLDEAHWGAWADHAELEGEVLLGFVTDTVAWVAEIRGPETPSVHRVLDIGSGPGVGTCELAQRFPDAVVVAVDGSPVMLERTEQRAAALGLDRRVSTHLAELPGPLDVRGVGHAESTDRTHIVSAMCRNAPANHAGRHDDLERVGAGLYQRI